MQNFFVILGGMGTLATESFVHQLNKKTLAHTDQEYLNYIVVNHADIPDRTAFIKDPNAEDPRPMLFNDIQTFSQLNPNFFVLTCNTAHYFYDSLQAHTEIPILHMPKIAVDSFPVNYSLQKDQPILFMGTEGSLLSGVYEQLINEAGYHFIAPPEKIQHEITTLIYQDIKEQNFLNVSLFKKIVEELLLREPTAYLLLGCTELSYLFEQFKEELPFPIIDAQSEVVTFILNKHSSQMDEQEY